MMKIELDRISAASASGFLPPNVVTNLRDYAEPEHINIRDLFALKRKLLTVKSELNFKIPKPQTPVPLHPIDITWSPDYLYFEIKDDVLTYNLWIWNLSSRLLYIYCSGLWNTNAGLGASWCFWPKTRFCLAPGLKAEMFVRAWPKPCPPVPCANAGFQISAGHKRDTVVANYLVPINVRFMNFEYPEEVEG